MLPLKVRQTGWQPQGVHAAKPFPHHPPLWKITVGSYHEIQRNPIISRGRTQNLPDVSCFAVFPRKTWHFAICAGMLPESEAFGLQDGNRPPPRDRVIWQAHERTSSQSVNADRELTFIAHRSSNEKNERAPATILAKTLHRWTNRMVGLG